MASVSVQPAMTQMPQASLVDSSADVYNIEQAWRELLLLCTFDQTPAATHHDDWIADALHSKVHAAARHLRHDLLDGLLVILGVDAVGGSKCSGLLELGRVDVHPDDSPRAGRLAAHDGGQSDGSEAKHGAHGVRFHLTDRQATGRKLFMCDQKRREELAAVVC